MNPNETTIVTGSPRETMEVGRRIAAELQAPELVMLIGDLGAGKTTLTKGLLEELGVAKSEDVASPTFSLVHEYGEDPKVYHIDLYRLDRVPELETLGLDDLWERPAIVLIEWGEKFSAELPGKRREVRLRYIDEDHREVRITPALPA